MNTKGRNLEQFTISLKLGMKVDQPTGARWKRKGIGEFETTETGLSTATALDNVGETVSFQVNKRYKSTGASEVVQSTSQSTEDPTSSTSRIERPLEIPATVRPEFIDYLNGGCEINLAIAIDFTASNGDPRQQGTPHCIHPRAAGQWNDYEKAIFAVGDILAKFDSDQRFPVWGFGAKYNNVLRHCFQCGPEVEVEGVKGILDAYSGVFQTPLTMSYPTKFTEVVRMAANYARYKQDVAYDAGKLSYTILLILTAGNVENVQETKEHLIEASNDPLSVVIVGIGEADLSGMEFIDAFNPAKDKGRDITKFVRFNDYKSYTALKEAVLDEIPDQLVNYYFDKGIMPGHDEGFSMEIVGD